MINCEIKVTQYIRFISSLNKLIINRFITEICMKYNIGMTMTMIEIIRKIHRM